MFSNDRPPVNNTFHNSQNQLSPTGNLTMNKYSDISESVASIFYTMNYGVIILCVCLLGIIGNAFNVIVFAKQGFQETVNVTLFAIAISDMASLLTLMVSGLFLSQFLDTLNLSFFPMEVQILFGGWAHVLFLRITAWLTALMSLERCFCVVFPLKVKSIFTLTKVKAGIVSIYLLVTASMAPIYYYTRLGWRFDAEKNKSILGLVFTHDRGPIERISYSINSVLSPIGYFAIIIVSTSILVVSLNNKMKWRQTATSSKTDGIGGQETSGKDKRVMKMIVTIATIFVVSLVPSNIVFVAQITELELTLVGKYQNMFKVVASFTMMLEGVSSSINTIVYYNMSSNYRHVFRSVILRKKNVLT